MVEFTIELSFYDYSFVFIIVIIWSFRWHL